MEEPRKRKTKEVTFPLPKKDRPRNDPPHRPQTSPIYAKSSRTWVEAQRSPSPMAPSLPSNSALTFSRLVERTSWKRFSTSKAPGTVLVGLVLFRLEGLRAGWSKIPSRRNKREPDPLLRSTPRDGERHELRRACVQNLTASHHIQGQGTCRPLIKTEIEAEKVRAKMLTFLRGSESSIPIFAPLNSNALWLACLGILYTIVMSSSQPHLPVLTSSKRWVILRKFFPQRGVADAPCQDHRTLCGDPCLSSWRVATGCSLLGTRCPLRSELASSVAPPV